MTKKIFSFGLVLLASLFLGTTFAGPNIKAGKWEITTETEMPGMPMKMPPVTHVQCMSQKDLVPQNRQPGQECEISNVSVSGDTVTWTVVCTNQGGTMEGKGRIAYRGDQMQGTMEMVMKGEGMKMTSRISGRRIGDCD